MKFEHTLILLQVFHIIGRIHVCGSVSLVQDITYTNNIFKTLSLSLSARFWHVQKDSMGNGSFQRFELSFPDAIFCKIQRWRYSWQIEVL